MKLHTKDIWPHMARRPRKIKVIKSLDNALSIRFRVENKMVHKFISSF